MESFLDSAIKFLINGVGDDRRPLLLMFACQFPLQHTVKNFAGLLRHKDPARGHAGRSAVESHPKQEDFTYPLQVRSRQNVNRIASAQLHRRRRKPRNQILEHRSPGGAAPGQEHFIHTDLHGLVRQGGVASKNDQEFLGNACIHRQLDEQPRHLLRPRRRFDHDRIAGRQSLRDLNSRQKQRIIGSADDEHHAKWLSINGRANRPKPQGGQPRPRIARLEHSPPTLVQPSDRVGQRHDLRGKRLGKTLPRRVCYRLRQCDAVLNQTRPERIEFRQPLLDRLLTPDQLRPVCSADPRRQRGLTCSRRSNGFLRRAIHE